MLRSSWFALVLIGVLHSLAVAQHDHGHAHGEAAAKPVERPKVFLDKSARVVAYQLKRLNNERLLLVERKTDDAKYAPVYKAILVRDGMSPQYREEALDGLVKLNQSDVVAEIVMAIDSLDPDDRQQRRTGTELARQLLARDVDALKSGTSGFDSATSSDNSIVRSLGYAGLIATGAIDGARAKASDNAGKVALLEALPLLSREADRNAVRPDVVQALQQDDEGVRKSALRALGMVTKSADENFGLLAPFVREAAYRTLAVRSMLKIPGEARDRELSTDLVKSLVKLAEDTPAAERTTDEFIDAMQLADQLFARLPVQMARDYRNRLRAVTVRVVQIHTIEEEMRYDIPYFVVEAGRPVQVVLKNEDLMPHNLVIVTDGSLQEVAQLGLAVGPNGGHEGKQYVPNSEKVLFATDMVPPDRSARLTFTAPTEAGNYPYVCTFPRHWMRMYGVMLVVDDLDAWMQNPVAPKDPLGSTRSFVQNWKVDDLKSDLATGLDGRSIDEGKQLFTEATCAQCHKADGEGGAVGPELNGVLTRWKGDHAAVLQEILDPSHRIDPKYAVHLIITDEGESISGIVAAEDKKTVSILANPESKELTVVDRDSIEEMVKTSTSMMPKGLLDRFTKEEILSLLAYVSKLAGRE